MHARMSTLTPKDTKDDWKQSSCLKTEWMRRIEQYKTMWTGQETSQKQWKEKGLYNFRWTRKKKKKERVAFRYKVADQSDKRRRRTRVQSCREASPGITSPAAFLPDNTNLQFPPETGRHSALLNQLGSTADSLGWRKYYSSTATTPIFLSAIKTYNSDSLYA